MKSADERWKIVVHEWRYGTERQRLKELIATLYEANKTLFKNEEDVFAYFAKAVFTGRLLDIARLVEKTLGKGAIRTLGEQTRLADDEAS